MTDRRYPAIDAIWRQGVEAFRADAPRDACPFNDEAGKQSWVRGWGAAKQAREDGTEWTPGEPDEPVKEMLVKKRGHHVSRCQWNGCGRRHADFYLGIFCCGCCRAEVRSSYESITTDYVCWRPHGRNCIVVLAAVLWRCDNFTEANQRRRLKTKGKQREEEEQTVPDTLDRSRTTEPHRANSAQCVKGMGGASWRKC